MEDFFKAKRDAKRQGSINDSQASKELREIEKAALASAAADAAMFGGGGASVLVPPPPPPRPQTMLQPPPPPPPRPPRPDYNQGFRRDKETEEKEAAAVANVPPPEPEGRYTVDGVTFLEGKHFGEMLVTGTECQLWVEAADQWANARILKVTVTAVPNTKLVLRKFAVAYRFTQGEGKGKGGEGEEREEDDVNADRLRMIEAQVVEAAAPPPPPVDTYTGLGGWQTVSVREVDEEAERLASKEAIKQETQRRKEQDKKRRMRMMEEALEGEDAMSSYDPHGRGYYKGVNLNATTTGAEEVSATAEVDLGGDADGPVAFKKKRKTGGGGGGGAAKFRRKRTADEDD